MEERAAETVPLPMPCAVPAVRPSPPRSSCEYHSTTTVRKKSLVVCEIITRFDRETAIIFKDIFFTKVENRIEKVAVKAGFVL